jgi:hypothetical protein
VEALLRPYLDNARDSKAPKSMSQFAPFADEVIDVLLDRSNGKPRDVLRKASALVEHGGERNLEVIDGVTAATILDSIAVPDDIDELVGQIAADVEDQWTY